MCSTSMCYTSNLGELKQTTLYTLTVLLEKGKLGTV